MQWRGSGFVVLGWWWLVAAIAAAGVLTMGFGDLRWGGRIMAGAFLLGAVIRLVADPPRRAGGLNSRSKSLDVTILIGLSLAVLIASATVKFPANDPRPPTQVGAR